VHLLLLADHEAPFATAEQVLRVAQARGARVALVLGRGDPHIGWSRVLEIPLGATEPVLVSPNDPDGRDLSGATVRLNLPEGATWEDGVKLILESLRRGAAGFQF
jgi:hypothetical protein